MTSVCYRAGLLQIQASEEDLAVLGGCRGEGCRAESSSGGLGPADHCGAEDLSAYVLMVERVVPRRRYWVGFRSTR